MSPKTVLEHHRFISSILSQAEKELLVPYNAAEKATPPKAKRPKVNYFEPETVKEILAAFDQEPIYRKAIGYIMVYSGARRGEILGLEWKNINFEKGVIRFEKNVLYVQGRGIYEDTLKTEMSERAISIPQSALAVLREYKEQWYEPVSVAHRLGHNQVSTTTNIYAHIMSKADERNAEILDEMF